jgi:hypothetical protein
VPYASGGQLFWGGKLRTNFGTRYNLAVVYPLNWPVGDIWAYVPELLNRSTPHKYADGHLCLYSNDHGGGGEGVCRAPPPPPWRPGAPPGSTPTRCTSARASGAADDLPILPSASGAVPADLLRCLVPREGLRGGGGGGRRRKPLEKGGGGPPGPGTPQAGGCVDPGGGGAGESSVQAERQALLLALRLPAAASFSPPSPDRGDLLRLRRVAAGPSGKRPPAGSAPMPEELRRRILLSKVPAHRGHPGTKRRITWPGGDVITWRSPEGLSGPFSPGGRLEERSVPHADSLRQAKRTEPQGSG